MTDTTTTTPPRFGPGANIAMKVPSRLFRETVAFYEETLGLPVTRDGSSAKVAFGGVTLWLDEVPAMTQPELWLELRTPDTAEAARHLAARGVPRCDEVEKLPNSFDGFWIAAPGGMIHLVRGEKGAAPAPDAT